jgi:hypothetical protein
MYGDWILELLIGSSLSKERGFPGMKYYSYCAPLQALAGQVSYFDTSTITLNPFSLFVTLTD